MKRISMNLIATLKRVPDSDPKPDPYVFGPPGSGIYLYGSGSFR
jgi:hypothetical protein